MPPALQKEHLLRRHLGLGHDGLRVLREAVEQMPTVADGDHVTDLIEIIIGIDAVGCQRRLDIIQLSVASGQMKSRRIMNKVALPHTVQRTVIHQHIDIHINIQLIFSALDLLFDLLALPIEPIGDMRKSRRAIIGTQCTQLSQLVDLAAGTAGNTGSFSLGTAFAKTVGTFVKHPLKTVRAEILGNADPLLLLTAEMVKAKRLADPLVDLLCRECLNLLG